ncbi:DNA-binding transcriptional LysR family regulator [Pedobacter agri]|nr:DNA-binding transcriptional LysR family regulator [Pedobacter agri]
MDCGILATPLTDVNISETPLYYENFVSYISKNSKLYKKKAVDAEDLNDENIWLLNEGHCMRNQVLNICRSTKNNRLQGLEYNTGSVETLVRMVDLNGGATLLPELAIAELNAKQTNKIRHFKSPEPVREISLVTHKNFIKKRMLNALKEEILAIIPKTMKQKKKKDIVGI